jgi:hypothetical protein
MAWGGMTELCRLAVQTFDRFHVRDNQPVKGPAVSSLTSF